MYPPYVYKFTLRMSDEGEDSLRELLEGFYSRPKNIRKNVLLHLTLTVVALGEENLKNMLGYLDTWKPRLTKVEAKLGRLHKIGQTYIGFELESNHLQSLHEDIVETFQPFTEEQYDPKYLKDSLNEKQKEYLNKYGYHRIKEYFTPHITIGKYENEKVRDEEYLIAPVVEGTIQFEKLVLDKSLSGLGIPAEIMWKMNLE